MPDQQAPFWRRKTLAEMTQRRMGEPVRRLRPLLPDKLRTRTPTRHLFTDVGCRLLDGQSCRCTRLREPPGQGARLRAADAAQCAAAELAAADLRLPAGGGGQDLSWWHPLVSGDPETVHAAGVSVRGRVAASEDDVPDAKLDGLYRQLAGQVAERGESARRADHSELDGRRHLPLGPIAKS